MNLRQQLIGDRVEKICKDQGIERDEAFETFVYSVVTGEGTFALAPEDWVDGHQDKQIDVIKIEEDEEEVEIVIVSAKYTSGFSSNAIIQLRNGLDWIFNRSREQVDAIANQAFRNKIIDIRETLRDFGPSNVTIRCCYACNGLSSEISDEYWQEAEGITGEYDNGTFANFTFQSVGATELVDLLKRMEAKQRSINVDVPILYDKNVASLIRYESRDLKRIVCTVTATDIAELVIGDTEGILFDSNIRRFLGKGKAVNSDILETATDSSLSHQFWFLNNGITVVCDAYDVVTDPDTPAIKVQNLQIVNGCQTATALAHAKRDGGLCSDTRVLLKVFKTGDPTLSRRIVITTNNQNRISTRDLKANDEIQQDMRERFAGYNLLYEHKVNQYSSLMLEPGQKVISNEDVGRAYLAIALRKPSDARRRKYKIWGEHYDEIFSGKVIEPHVICVLLYESAKTWAKQTLRDGNLSDLGRRLTRNGLLHITRIASTFWRAKDHFNQQDTKFSAYITELQTEPTRLYRHFDKALKHLEGIMTNNPSFEADVDAALKSALLETAITRSLNSKT